MCEQSVKFEVRWHPAANRELERIPSGDQQRIVGRVNRLADEPRPRGCERVRGVDAAWRIRVGNYRVLYQIQPEEVVFIGRVDTRGSAYANLETLSIRFRPIRQR